jgi:hypothetical protein
MSFMIHWDLGHNPQHATAISQCESVKSFIWEVLKSKEQLNEVIC